MHKVLSSIVLTAAIALSPTAMALGNSGGSTAHTTGDSHFASAKIAPQAGSNVVHVKTTTVATPKSGKHNGNYAQGVRRDAKGKIARNSKAKTGFKKLHPCPSTGRTTGACPGYVIDHVQALKRGGADMPSNMQWQTVAAAKQKDKTE